MVHRISPEEASYKLVKVRRLQVGKGKVPFIATHDGRTIRYPDPDIRVRRMLLLSHPCLMAVRFLLNARSLQPSMSC